MGPVAMLSNPAPGESITATALNAAGYIDVTYKSLTGAPIDESTLSSMLAPFKLTGTGLANVKFNPSPNGSVPILSAAPQPLDGPSTTDTSVTYRYFLTPVDSTQPLFSAGAVTITYTAGAFSTAAVPSGAGGPIPAANDPGGMTQTFTISNSAPGAATTSKAISLGPITLQGPHAGLENFGFKNGMLDVTVALGVDRASLATSGGITANLTGLQGTLEVQVDVLGLLGGHVRINVPGKFSLSVAALTITVPQVVTITGSGIQIAYDPAGGSHQKLVTIQSASISVPKFGLTGTIMPFDPTSGQNVSHRPDEAARRGSDPGPRRIRRRLPTRPGLAHVQADQRPADHARRHPQLQRPDRRG